MAREQERLVVDTIVEILGARKGRTPAWLQRPGRTECGARWPLVRRMYAELTGMDLPQAAPAGERRTVDAVLIDRAGRHRILEFDEVQHFNHYRAATLRAYDDVNVAFDIGVWLTRCRAKSKLEGGGFARPCPPLFPQADGRHRQRAFRDALTDILPGEHGWLPTLRIADFEVADWVYSDQRTQRLETLLTDRLS